MLSFFPYQNRNSVLVSGKMKLGAIERGDQGGSNGSTVLSSKHISRRNSYRPSKIRGCPYSFFVRSGNFLEISVEKERNSPPTTSDFPQKICQNDRFGELSPFLIFRKL